MTLKLYGRNGSGSVAVETLLHITNMPHEIVDVPKQEGGGMPGWFLAINPAAQVPALALADGTIMTESAAILIYLADLPECRYRGSRLTPGLNDPFRAPCLRWMVFLSAAQYEAVLRYYYADRYSTETGHASAIQARAAQQITTNFERFAAAADKTGPFFFGASLSIIDIYVAMLIGWAPDVDALFQALPRLRQIYSAVMDEADIRALFTHHGMPQS